MGRFGWRFDIARRVYRGGRPEFESVDHEGPGYHRRPMTTVQIDVERYAAISVELARDGADRAAVLAAHGLEPSDWETIDAYWQERLSSAMESDEDGVPEVIALHSAAFARA